MTYSVKEQNHVLSEEERAIFDTIPLRQPDNVVVLNAIHTLRTEVEALRTLIDTPERRLEAAGLHYAKHLPARREG